MIRWNVSWMFLVFMLLINYLVVSFWLLVDCFNDQQLTTNTQL
jgi:hypothetical protein